MGLLEEFGLLGIAKDGRGEGVWYSTDEVRDLVVEATVTVVNLKTVEEDSSLIEFEAEGGTVTDEADARLCLCEPFEEVSLQLAVCAGLAYLGKKHWSQS